MGAVDATQVETQVDTAAVEEVSKNMKEIGESPAAASAGSVFDELHTSCGLKLG